MSSEFSFPTVMYGISNLLPIPTDQFLSRRRSTARALYRVDEPTAERQTGCSPRSGGHQSPVDLLPDVLTQRTTHNLIKLRIGNWLVRISAGWSKSCWNVWRPL